MEERKQFTFFRSYLDSAKALDTKEEQADFLLAICEYGLNGVLPEQKKGFVAAVFAAVKPNLDSSLAKAKAGSAGGRAKQTEANASNLEANSSKEEANASTSEANASNLEAIKNKEDRSKNKEYIKPYSTIEEAFESFWNEYPNRKGKGKAREAFKKAIKKTGISTMVEAVRKQRQGSQWKKDEGRYIPYPATWLNQERWEDEVDTNGDGTGYPEEPGLQRLADWEQQHTL
jgi:hypothetical protein